MNETTIDFPLYWILVVPLLMLLSFSPLLLPQSHAKIAVVCSRGEMAQTGRLATLPSVDGRGYTYNSIYIDTYIYT